MPCWIRGWGLIHRIYAAEHKFAYAACMQRVDLSVAITAGRPRRSGSLLTIRRTDFWPSSEPHMRRNVTVEWDGAWDGARHTCLLVAAGRSALIGRANLVWLMRSHLAGAVHLFCTYPRHRSPLPPALPFSLPRKTTATSSIFTRCDVAARTLRTGIMKPAVPRRRARQPTHANRQWVTRQVGT